MSSEFNPNFFAFGDRSGQGQWEIGHYRQHLRYLDVLGAQTPPSTAVPDFDISSMGASKEERRGWLQDHFTIHAALRNLTNVTGVDLTALNFDNEQAFDQWLSDHATEHQQLDTAFGLA
jgi:hypothetical protein